RSSATVLAPSRAVNTAKRFLSARSNLPAPGPASPPPHRPVAAVVPSLSAAAPQPGVQLALALQIVPQCGLRTLRPPCPATFRIAAESGSRTGQCLPTVRTPRTPSESHHSRGLHRTASPKPQNIALLGSARCTTPPRIPESVATSDVLPQCCPLP